jgi:hypothetical protein
VLVIVAVSFSVCFPVLVWLLVWVLYPPNRGRLRLIGNIAETKANKRTPPAR